MAGARNQVNTAARETLRQISPDGWYPASRQHGRDHRDRDDPQQDQVGDRVGPVGDAPAGEDSHPAAFTAMFVTHIGSTPKSFRSR